MFLFIAGIILILIAAALFFTKVPRQVTVQGRRMKTVAPTPRIIPIGVLVVGLLLFGLSFVTTVDAKEEGVVKSFGSISENTLDPGLNSKAPWAKVIEVDAANQTVKYHGKDPKDDDKDDNTFYSDCIKVLLGDGSESCASVTNRYRVNPDRAADIYKNYRSDDPTQDLGKVVSTELTSVVQDTVGSYNPLTNLKVVDADQAASSKIKFTPNYDQLSKDTTDALRKRFGNDPLVKITKVSVTFVPLPKSTRNKISQFTGEVANTRTQAQKAQSAKKQADAINTLKKALDNAGPGVLQSKCLDTMQEAIEKGYPSPAGGWNCLGGGGSVVLPSGK